MENWKPVVGYEGLYEISDMWNVKSLNYHQKWIQQNLIPQNARWYLFVRLSKKWVIEKLQVHRTVAKTFIENIHNKKEVNHINWIKTDNRLENLEWCTRSENMIHADINKLRIMPKWENAWWFWKRWKIKDGLRIYLEI